MATQLAHGPIATYGTESEEGYKWHCRVFYQDTSGQIFSAIQYAGFWRSEPLFMAKPSTPLAAVGWKEGKEIRLYCVSVEDYLVEWCLSPEKNRYGESEGKTWRRGDLSSLEVKIAPGSSIAAVGLNGTDLRVYCQEPNTGVIHEYVNRRGWSLRHTFPAALEGTGIAAVNWEEDSGRNVRVFYQDQDLNLQEHVCHGQAWSKAGVNLGPIPKKAPISATAWLNDGSTGSRLRICLYWQDNKGSLTGQEYDNGWKPIGSVWPMPAGTYLASLQWARGKAIRVYYQTADAGISEACFQEGKWFAGSTVATSEKAE
ncbi:hypothetical protein PCL_07297 [Purpureocillium lilacinum]|uniref:Uncharacterized protein n=1 Tax=Purpureocillium lilacinum TaxID=33203 RepID=A0A2U3DSL8_PURLI|nr:hypothetical protein PCL_07297 [Purpureocillium lilacinum]